MRSLLYSGFSSPRFYLDCSFFPSLSLLVLLSNSSTFEVLYFVRFIVMQLLFELDVCDEWAVRSSFFAQMQTYTIYLVWFRFFCLLLCWIFAEHMNFIYMWVRRISIRCICFGTCRKKEKKRKTNWNQSFSSILHSCFEWKKVEQIEMAGNVIN